MTNSYADTILEGEDAYNNLATRKQNPYVFRATAWYAWDIGWAAAERRNNPRPNDVDLELEASLVAYGESVQR